MGEKEESDTLKINMGKGPTWEGWDSLGVGGRGRVGGVVSETALLNGPGHWLSA